MFKIPMGFGQKKPVLQNTYPGPKIDMYIENQQKEADVVCVMCLRVSRAQLASLI